MVHFELALTPPFDPELSLAFWLRSPHETVDLVRDGSYRRLFFREHRPLLLTVTLTGSVDKPACEVSLSGGATEADRLWAEDTVRWILHDHAPLREFYAHVQETDVRMAELSQSFRGLRPPLSPAPFETLVFAIVGQQVNLNFAYQMKAALEERFARTATIAGVEYRTGLAPGDFQNAEISDLRAMKISNAKSRAILELAAALRKTPLNRGNLLKLGQDKIMSFLTAFRGIGPWTAEYTMLRALGITTALPAGDAGLQNAVRLVYDLPERPTEEKVRSLGREWAPYEALATFYLWTSLMKNKIKS